MECTTKTMLKEQDYNFLIFRMIQNYEGKTKKISPLEIPLRANEAI